MIISKGKNLQPIADPAVELVHSHSCSQDLPLQIRGSDLMKSIPLWWLTSLSRL